MQRERLYTVYAAVATLQSILPEKKKKINSSSITVYSVHHYTTVTDVSHRAAGKNDS